MILKRFNVLVIIRLVLIMGSVMVLGWIAGDKRLFFNQIILGIIVIAQVYELLRFINQTNRELTRFFLAIRHSDFTLTFKQSGLGSTFKDLERSMGEIISSYNQVKIEKEVQFQFLKMLVNQLHVGLIAFETDEIILINPTAERLLDAKSLKSWKVFHQIQPSLAHDIDALGNQDTKLLPMKIGSETTFVSVHSSVLSILNKPHKIVTFQDINSEIEQKEIEAWHKLIRILTHEIMNSVTPISSLSETLESLMQTKTGEPKKVKDLTDDNISDIRFSLSTIRKRSDGLLGFVDSYRQLTKLPKPDFTSVNVFEFVSTVTQLLTGEFRENNIAIRINVAEDLVMSCDRVLMEQVLINLLTNSVHALRSVERPREIVISAYHREKEMVITVQDNGKGISEKEIDQIFIPFFSTRKEGSGIGLSLSRQIMRAHAGSINATSELNVGTTMTLRMKDR